MRSVAATLVLGSVGLMAAASAGAAPTPAKFWTVSSCQRVLDAHDYPLSGERERLHGRVVDALRPGRCVLPAVQVSRTKPRSAPRTTTCLDRFSDEEIAGLSFALVGMAGSRR